MGLLLLFLFVLPVTDTPERVLEERGGGRLELSGGRLTRVRGGVRTELTAAGTDTGRILDLALDPAGLTFAAAEQGLFVLSPAVDVLDRVEPGPRAPTGSPRSVLVDARRRVWVATESQVGVLEPSFHYGRTLGPEELPGAGPYTLAPTAKGILIRGAGGERPYVPDEREVPRVAWVALGDERREASGGPVLALSYGASLPLRAGGSATGGATFRYRVDGHHVWQALEEDTRLDWHSPGRHLVEVVAVDRDLDFSAPFAIPLTVDYPVYYAHGFVLGVAAGAGLLVLGWFLARAYRGGGGRRAYGRALVSAGLLLVLAVQVLAGLVPHGRGWPFMGFSMYADRYEEGDAVYDAVLVGIEPRGREFVIDPQAVGVAVDSRWQVLRPLIDGGEEAARQYLASFRERHPQRSLRWLQVQARRIRLTSEGPQAVAPLVLYSYEDTGGG